METPKARRSFKGLLFGLGAALFVLLEAVQLLGGALGSTTRPQARNGIFLVSAAPGKGGCPGELLPLDSVEAFPSGKWVARVHAVLRREKRERVRAVVPGKVSLPRTAGVSWSGPGAVVSDKPAGRKAFVEVRLDFHGVESLPPPDPWERTRIFLRFRNLFSRNPCLPDPDLRVVLADGRMETFRLSRVPGVRGEGPLLSKDDLSAEGFEEKGFGYLLRRELGLPAGKKWVYAQDGPLTILQRRLDFPLVRLGSLQVHLSPEAVLERLNLRVGGGLLSPSRIVPFSSLPTRIFQGEGEKVVDVDLRPLGPMGRAGSARLQEIVLGLPGKCGDFLRQRWVRKLAFFGPGKREDERKNVPVASARFQDAGGGTRALVLNLPFRARAVFLQFRPSIPLLPWGCSFPGGRMLLFEPLRAPVLLPGLPGDSGGEERPGLSGKDSFPAVETVAFWARGLRVPAPRGNGSGPGNAGLPAEGKILRLAGGEGAARFAWEIGAIPGGKYFLEVKPGVGRDCRLAFAIPFLEGKAGGKSACREDGKAPVKGPLDRLVLALEGPDAGDPLALAEARLYRVVRRSPAGILARKRLLGGSYPLQVSAVQAPPGLVVQRAGSRLFLQGRWKPGETGPVRVTLRARGGGFVLQGLEVEAGRPFPSGTTLPWKLSFLPFPGWARGLERFGLSGAGRPFFRVLPRNSGKGTLERGNHGWGVVLSVFPPEEWARKGGWISLDFKFRWRGWRFVSPLEDALKKPLLAWRGRPLALRVAGNPSPEGILHRGLWMEGRFRASRRRTSWKGLLDLLPREGLEVERVILEPPGKVRRAPAGVPSAPAGLASWSLPPGAGAELLGLALLVLAFLWRRIVAAVAVVFGHPGRKDFSRGAYLLGFVLFLGLGWVLLFFGRSGPSAPFFVFALYMLAGMGLSARPAGENQP